MLSYFRRNKDGSKDSNPRSSSPDTQAVTDGVSTSDSTPVSDTATRPSFFARLRSGLSKTREKFASGLTTLLRGKQRIDDALYDELETQLLSADVGYDATTAILERLNAVIATHPPQENGDLLPLLRQVLYDLLLPIEQPLTLPASPQLTIILMVGINGAGKTTTIGKLAKRFQTEGKRVMLAAGDTFRAAAVEQLQSWGERNQVPVIASGSGGDSASVIFDAIHAAKARGIDVLIADTAGRLHTQDHLMAELQKVKRVIQKLVPEGPDEVMLVLDASIGQNALIQAREFGEAVGVTGLTMTKLDGTAKGGIIFAIAQQQRIPLRYIGVGEDIDDLRVFHAKEFVDALFE